MNLELDHVFILVESGAQAVDRLLEKGFQEGPRNTHPGQGTANRRVYFANGMVEFLWVRDAHEANNGPGRDLRFPERSQDPQASPFGAIFVPRHNPVSQAMPFPGWHYQPNYFPPPKGFHVGANSQNLLEPLCFYFPFQDPGVPRPQPERNSQRITEVVISTPSADTHGVLALASKCVGLPVLCTYRLAIQTGQEHLMEITLDHHNSGRIQDFRPALPLILRW
ncbi:MAG: VOC family protein [Cyanobacteria bacterium P01_D01_bin.115]